LENDLYCHVQLLNCPLAIPIRPLQKAISGFDDCLRVLVVVIEFIPINFLLAFVNVLVDLGH
jgi:hypothetical protein